MPSPFLDTNIILRHLLQDHPDHSPRASKLIVEIEQGNVVVHTADTVIFEAVFTLERTHRIPKSKIRDGLLALINLPGIELPGKRRLERVFDLYVELNISFIDAYHAVMCEQMGVEEIFSFDRDFDRVSTLRRREP